MCGRYGRFSRKERIEAVLGQSIDGPAELEARYNVCPGLPDCWHEGNADAIPSYILMTTVPNELAAKVHDRMPVTPLATLPFGSNRRFATPSG